MLRHGSLIVEALLMSPRPGALWGGRRALGPWPGLRQAGAGSEMLAQRSPASVLRLGMCSCTQPLSSAAQMEGAPMMKNTAFHPLNWPLYYSGYLKSFLARCRLCWPSGGRKRLLV